MRSSSSWEERPATNDATIANPSSILPARSAEELQAASEHAGQSGVGSVELKLPTRQRECLQLVAEGATSGEIGRILGLSTRTVDHYVRFACAKLGVRSRAQAVAIATDLKLIRVSRSD